MVQKAVPAKKFRVKGENRAREMADLLMLRRAYRMGQASAEKLEQTGLSKMERVTLVPQSEQ